MHLLISSKANRFPPLPIRDRVPLLLPTLAVHQRNLSYRYFRQFTPSLHSLKGQMFERSNRSYPQQFGWTHLLDRKQATVVQMPLSVWRFVIGVLALFV